MVEYKNLFRKMLELKKVCIDDAVAKRPNAAVCKTAIRGFDSRLHLQILRSNTAGACESPISISR